MASKADDALIKQAMKLVKGERHQQLRLQEQQQRQRRLDLAKEREQQLRQAIAGAIVATSGSTKHTPTQDGVDDVLATLQAMGAPCWNGKTELPHMCVERPHVMWLLLIGLYNPKALPGVQQLAQQMLRMFRVQLQVRYLVVARTSVIAHGAAAQ